MTTTAFLNRFLLNDRRIPELSQIYHHVYFRDLDANLLSGNELMMRFWGISNYSDFEQKPYHHRIKDPGTLKTILADDEIVLSSTEVKIFAESAKSNLKAEDFISIKSPLYNAKQLIGLCGISLQIGHQNFSDFSNTLDIVGKILNQDLSITTSPSLLSLREGSKPALTARELDCLALYMKGNTVKNIAEKLKLSSRTIESYIDNIKSKFGVNKRSELIQAAFNMYPDLVKS